MLAQDKYQFRGGQSGAALGMPYFETQSFNREGDHEETPDMNADAHRIMHCHSPRKTTSYHDAMAPVVSSTQASNRPLVFKNLMKYGVSRMIVSGPFGP